MTASPFLPWLYLKGGQLSHMLAFGPWYWKMREKDFSAVEMYSRAPAMKIMLLISDLRVLDMLMLSLSPLDIGGIHNYCLFLEQESLKC